MNNDIVGYVVIIASISFGMWQKRISAGIWMFVILILILGILKSFR